MGQSDAVAEAIAAEPVATARAAAMVIYYAQHAYREKNGQFAAEAETLRAAGLLDDATAALSAVSLELRGADGFIATVSVAADGESWASVTEERFVRSSSIGANDGDARGDKVEL